MTSESKAIVKAGPPPDGELASLTHAEGEAPALVPAQMPEQRIDRVRVIAGLMTRQLWRTGYSEELAKLWGANHTTVRRYAAEASQIVREAIDPDLVMQESMQCLRRLVDMAEQGGDVKGAVTAMRLQLEAMGLLKQRSEHTHRFADLELDDIVKELEACGIFVQFRRKE